MGIMDYVSRIFGKEYQVSSKSIAKERLRLVLVHDRMDISEGVMNALRNDLIEVISKYMVIDKKALEVSLSKDDNSVALVANIPVLNVKRPSLGDDDNFSL
jgi:cell division topological specificity factor